MSTIALSHKSKPSKKDKEKKRDLHHPDRDRERLKSVVRRLPPNLPEDVFWESVAQWVTDESVSWKVFCSGKLKKRDRLGKENIPSRAYIAFRSEEQLVVFGREYDGHLFRDKNGNEYQAVVEYAPYQKVPSEKKKVDARNNTIEKDEDYISFIASLKASETAEPPSLEALLAASQPQPPPKTTPLLEALKAEKTAHKDKEAILRSHAHYKDKDPTILAPPPRGGPAESKKKGAKAAPAPAQVPESSGVSKKGKKAVPPPAQTHAQVQVKGPQTQQQAQIQQSGKPAPAPQASAKPAKAPRPPKPAKAPKQAPVAPTAPVTIATPPVSAAAASSSSLQASTTQGQAPTPAPAPAPRRMRPVIGLASRHFEAALSGVAGGARARREQQQQQQQQAAAQKTGDAISASASASIAASSLPDTVSSPPTTSSATGPPSPRRARREREKPREGQGQGGEGQAQGEVGVGAGGGGRGGGRRGRGGRGGGGGGRGGAGRGGV